MKTLFLFTLTIILALNLNARENPFEATDSFEEELDKAAVLDEKAIKRSMEEAPYIKEMQEKMSNVSGQSANKNKVEDNSNKPAPTPEEKSYTKKEVDTLIQKTQKQTEQKAKELVKKEVQNNHEVIVEPTGFIVKADSYVIPKTKIDNSY